MKPIEIRPILAAAVLCAAIATAQAADTTGCTPQEKQQAKQNAPSQKLDDTAAVICPPDVDPAMNAPTPKTGDKAVIPPPGSPGGDPNVQPK
jgi:type IV secretory pathway VirB10-like protein